MMRCACVCVFAVICISVVSAQFPPRLQIPGAVLVGSRPPPRNTRIQGDSLGPRPRRPLPPPLSNALPIPIREVRPVVEESHDPFDEEVNKLGISALQSALGDAVSEDEEIENIPRPSQGTFRPERPVPISRDNIRDKPPQPRPTQQVIRQELRQEQRQVLRQERPQPRQETIREENIPRPPLRQTRPPPQQSQTPVYRPPSPARAAARPQPLDDDDDRPRNKKPQVQILRKYRTDNEDGSITWGFENDDGTFKEETLGIDCIISGKYGYVDPDGVRREYQYQAGNQCDPTEEEEEAELAAQRPNIPPQARNKPQPQSRPQSQSQYSN